jgi:RNA polymerase sigma-54 factor
MALEQRLNLKQTLQLRMTPQLRQAIKILQVSRAELETIITEELSQNPTLDELGGEEVAAAPTDQRTGDPETTEAEPAEVAPVADKETEASDLATVDWEDYLDRYGSDFHGSIGTGSDRDDNDRTSFLENTAASADDLVTALSDQLHLVPMSEDERRVGGIVVQNLNQNGYLSCTPEEIAFMASCSVEMVNDAREIIQEFEPPGCASLDLRECLLVQLRLIGYEPDDYVVQIVDQHLADLESRRYEKLSKALGTTVDEVVECHRIIQALEPKPGRNFDEGDTRYIVPDVYIVRVGEEFQVVLNDEGLPNLRINSYYRQMASSGNGGDAKTYIQDKMRSAVWLIRSIEQRQRTLRKVTESIVRFQRKFLLHGVQHLKPMVLKDVANDIGMHESTVSRATANKYVHTPQGIFELKYFFTSSIRGTDGTDVSSESVKQRIQQIISREDPRKPFSDQYIAEALSRDNIDIARRTVAKYRELLGILPSSKRKRYVANT